MRYINIIHIYIYMRACVRVRVCVCFVRFMRQHYSHLVHVVSKAQVTF